MGSYDMFHPKGEEVPPMPMDLARVLTGPSLPDKRACTFLLATIAIIDLLSQSGSRHPAKISPYQRRETRSNALD